MLFTFGLKNSRPFAATGDVQARGAKPRLCHTTLPVPMSRAYSPLELTAQEIRPLVSSTGEHAWSGQPPTTSRPRLLNLRIYESHNERAGRKKVEMFNKGELDIFRRVGLTPVFFGEAVAGPLMPNLTYLLVFPDEAGRKSAWEKFRADAAWLKLKAIPEYADKEIVSKITNVLLVPANYSEI